MTHRIFKYCKKPVHVNTYICQEDLTEVGIQIYYTQIPDN